MSNLRGQYYEKSMSVQGELLDYDEWARHIFWYPLDDEMRLNFEGWKHLEKHFTCHIVDIVDGDKKPIISKHLIFLSRFCRQPYYIYGSDHIVFFDEEEAFIFKLCDGDIDNVETIAPERLSDD